MKYWQGVIILLILAATGTGLISEGVMEIKLRSSNYTQHDIYDLGCVNFSKGGRICNITDVIPIVTNTTYNITTVNNITEINNFTIENNYSIVNNFTVTNNFTIIINDTFLINTSLQYVGLINSMLLNISDSFLLTDLTTKNYTNISMTGGKFLFLSDEYKSTYIKTWFDSNRLATYLYGPSNCGAGNYNFINALNGSSTHWLIGDDFETCDIDIVNSLGGIYISTKSGTHVLPSVTKQIDFGASTASWDNCYCDDYITTPPQKTFLVNDSISKLKLLQDISFLKNGEINYTSIPYELRDDKGNNDTLSLYAIIMAQREIILNLTKDMAIMKNRIALIK